ncbi:MAG: beta-propeller domain-containing protein, partial [Thermoplasmata archaeon]|nr:beta-propeller domain-containing protein [Thermoplasmata archaeon]
MIIGRQQMFGQPVDMYVVDTKAYVILSSFYYYGFRFIEVGGDSIWSPYNWEGSQICIVDVTDNTAPYIINKIELEGAVTDTRRVGDVIYAVSTEYDYYWLWDDIDVVEDGSSGDGDDYTGPNTYVISLNFADPNSIKEVDSAQFPGTSNEIHVTQDALYVAKPSYGDESTNWEPYTEITYVDISDPRGIISVRDTFRTEGRLEDRYQMDHYDDMFRMVTHFWTGIGESKLWIYDVSNPDEITKLGELLVDDAGSLMATRFEKERAYTIHLPRSIDPLDTIDLSDPANPELCDVLEMPGWVEHIEVRGFKLLALGVDDSEGQRKVAVSIFDVTDPYNTVLEDRVTIGEGYSWSGANWDPKALSVIDDQNLILVPFTSYSYDEYSGESSSINGVQIVEFDLDNNDLIARGVIENAADQVLRTRAYQDRILSTSNHFLQVIDATDSDNPEITAQLELCTDIKDMAIMDDYAVQFVDTWWDEANRYKFRVVEADEPDSYPPLAEINIGNSDYCYMYTNDDLIYIFESDYEWDYYGGESSFESSVTIYDFSKPLDPEVLGTLELPFYLGYFYPSVYMGYTPTEYYGYYYSSSELLQMDGSIFIYHPGNSYYYNDYYYLEEGRVDGRGDEPVYNEKVYILDLSNPASPQLASEYGFDADQILNFKVRERMLYFTVMETVTDEEYGYGWTNARYYLGKIDLTDPYNPELLNLVNIPGTFVDASDDGSTIYTTSTWFEKVDDYNTQVQTFNVLTLANDIASLQSAIQMDGTIRSVYIEDGIAYFTLTQQEVRDYEGDDVGTGSTGSSSGSSS